MELILTGRYLSAREAEQFGLAARVVPAEVYLNEALKLANEIAARPPIAVRFAKEAINKAFETSLSEGLDFERRLFTSPLPRKIKRKACGLLSKSAKRNGRVVSALMYPT